MRLAGGFVLAAALALAPSAPSAARAGRAATDWTKTVVATPLGAFRMGNPKAKVRLVEYVSLTCSHCRTFEEEAGGVLIGKYVKSGKVSLELRNFVRDPYDVSAALIARCNGPASFFRLNRALLKDQPTWMGNAQAAAPDQIEAAQKLPPHQLFVATAKLAGLQKWAVGHGVPVARSSQCLSDRKAIDRLIAMNAATQQYPHFHGTPSFVLNGRMLEGVSTWEQLEPELRAALGG